MIASNIYDGDFLGGTDAYSALHSLNEAFYVVLQSVAELIAASAAMLLNLKSASCTVLRVA